MASSEGHQNCIFFDNEQYNIDTVGKCSNILCVKVGGLEVKPVPKVAIEGIAHFDGIPENLRRLWTVKGMTQYDETSGLTAEHFDALKRWYGTVKYSEIKYAVFDFDRTISKVESIPVGVGWTKGISDWYRYVEKSERKGLLKQFVQFLCGNDERIRLLTDIFKFCKENDIFTIILTNNKTSETNPQIYRDVMSYFDMPDITVAYGEGQKREWFESSVYSNLGCLMTTGGTRHSQRNRSSRSRRRRQSVKRRTQPRKPVSHRRVRRQ